MSAPAITPQEVDQFVSALAGIDPAKVYADFKSGNVELEIGDVLLIAQVGTEGAGYFFPAAATASQWIGLARALMPVLIKGAIFANEHLPPPEKLQPNEYEAWGHVFTR